MTDTPVSDTATLATLNDNVRRASGDHVDIRQARAEFNQLQRELSRAGQSSTPQPKRLPKDVENASQDTSTEEGFDLREYLTSSNDAGQAAGIKHKHVGVTWEDLQVTGIGGEDNKVSFPFYAGSVFPQLTVSVLDLCPHVLRRHPRGTLVPGYTAVVSRGHLSPRKVYPSPSNTYNHSQVRKPVTRLHFGPAYIIFPLGIPDF